MMKAQQKWLLVLVIAAALLAAAFFVDPQRRIGRFVRKNREELEAVVRECWGDPPHPTEYKGHPIRGTVNVWFSWSSGWKPGSAACYYGFYYSIDEDPLPYPGMGQYDETVQMFSWTWKEPGGSSGCTTRHITRNWYYYEAWF